MSETAVIIGVSLDIPPDLSEQVTRVRRASGDPLADVVRPHITLLPPTPVPSSGVGAIGEHLASVFASEAPFEVTLRGTSTFRPVSPVVFLAVRRGARRCAQLASAVRSGPLAVDLAFPYVPHVTVAQGVSDEALDIAATALAGTERTFPVTSARWDIQRADGTWTPQSAFEFSASAGGSRGRVPPREGSRRR